MSFQIKDKNKLQLFKKVIEIISSEHQYFGIQFCTNHIVIFSSELNTFAIYLNEKWFSRFKCPNPYHEYEPDENYKIHFQVKLDRDIFKQSMNLNDDKDIEVIINQEIRNNQGSLKIIKSKEQFLVEAKVPFEIDWDQETNFWKHDIISSFFNFEDDNLLLKSDYANILNVKKVFYQTHKNDMMHLEFTS